MNRDKEIKLIFVALILVALLVLAYAAYDAGFTVEEIAPGEELRRPRGEGRVSRDFPEELILEEDIRVSDSYSIRYLDEGNLVPVVRYESQWTLEQNIEEFSLYFFQNGWTITHNASTEEFNRPYTSFTYFYAERGDAEANVTFSYSPGNVLGVSIAYLAP